MAQNENPPPSDKKPLVDPSSADIALDFSKPANSDSGAVRLDQMQNPSSGSSVRASSPAYIALSWR